MKNRQYQGVQLSKKESELVEWLQRGEHDWYDAFYVYPQRRKPKGKKAIRVGNLKERSWFNSTLATLQLKGLCRNIPFVYTGLKWKNPGIEASKANLVAMAIQETNFDKGAQRHVIQG